MSSSAAAPSIIYLVMDVHKDSITIAVLPAAAKSPTRLERLPNDLPKLKRFLDRVARDGETPRLLRGQRRRVRPAPGAARVGPRVRRDRALAHPEAARRAAEARRARCRRPRPVLPPRRAHAGPHSERGRGAGAGRRPVPRDVPARDPQVAPLHPQVPRPPRVHLSRGDELAHTGAAMVTPVGIPGRG